MEPPDRGSHRRHVHPGGRHDLPDRRRGPAARLRLVHRRRGTPLRRDRPRRHRPRRSWRHLEPPESHTGRRNLRPRRRRLVYRIAGGAPLRIGTWDSVGGTHPYTTIDPAAITKAGTGTTWNQLRVLPRDGTFVRAGTTTYRIAGGAPLHVSDWSTVGGEHPYVAIDPADIAHAGAGGTWNHLRATPADGTFIRAGGVVYRIAGGAPLRIGNWDSVGGTHPYTTIDPAAITKAGTGITWNQLRVRPRDGTFVRAGGVVYRIAGGAPLRVGNWDSVGGTHPYTTIDPAAITKAGTGGSFNHLSAKPAPGTYIRSGTQIFRIAGGAPLVVTSWTPLGGSQPYTVVDPAVVLHAGQPGVWSHLNWYPADGTFLEGLPGKHIFRVKGGRAVLVTSWTPYGGPQPFVAITQATIDRAGSGGGYNHLRG